MTFLVLSFSIYWIRNLNLVGCVTALATGYLLLNLNTCVPTQCILRRLHGEESGVGIFSSANTSVFPCQ